jgi:hypothetical protein
MLKFSRSIIIYLVLIIHHDLIGTFNVKRITLII